MPNPRPQALVFGCLVLSGSTSLIYELLWTRILSFSFGSTSLAFAAVLAVFFLGLAGGSMLGGRMARRLVNPLRAYAWLELSIGAYAGAAFPFLFDLHHLFALHNAGGAEPSGFAFRLAAAAVVLALPTLCMGATFPVLLEHLRRGRSPLTQALGRLYGVNTLGAFLGVYLATHWLIPGLGLDKANYAAVALNVLVFAAAWAGGRSPVPAGAGADLAEALPAVGAAGNSRRYAWIGLILLAASGCTTLAYEVVWGRVLTIALEGSLYGIGTTLGSFLAGIGLGGLLFSFAAGRLRSPEILFRAYLITCLLVISYLALSRFLLPVEGYLLRAANHGLRGYLGLHANFAIGVLFLLPVTAGLGFMFPAAVALYNLGRTDPAYGAGKAYALNTAMSVLGSLASASVLMDNLGIEGVVFLGALVMLGSLLASVLLAEAGKPARLAWLALVAVPLTLTAGWWPSIDAKTVLLSSPDGQKPSLNRMFASLAAQFTPQPNLKVYKDGVGTTLTVFLQGRTAALLSNGLPQSGRSMDPPHFNLESSLVGLYPALHKPDGRKALVIGLGAGITVDVLRKAGVPRVDVVELEPAMADICKAIYPAGRSPLDDGGVTLHLDDARNYLVRNGYRETPSAWDIIASQPAHPWVSGAADLFTEDMFRLAYRNLAEGGVFCQWFMGTGIDDRSFGALANAFGRVFDQVIVYRTFGTASGLYFIGSKGRMGFSLTEAERIFANPEIGRILALNHHPTPADVFKYAATAIVDGKSILQAGYPVNRDRNAFVEARMPLLPKRASMAVGGLGTPASAGPVPAAAGGSASPSTRDSLFAFKAIDALSGNVLGPYKDSESDSTRILRMVSFRKHAPEPYREYYRLHIELASGRMRPEALGAAADSAARAGRALLAQQIRLLRLKRGAAGEGPALPPGLDSLPEDFQREFHSRAVLALAEAGRGAESERIASQGLADTVDVLMARLLLARTAGKAAPDGPIMDEARFDRLYRKCLLEWVRREGYVEALHAYCAATGRISQALMAKRLMDRSASDAAKELVAKGMRWKSTGRHSEALDAFSKATQKDPANLDAFLGQAEILGLKGDKAGYESLANSIRKVFPQPDVQLQRLEDAYTLAPKVTATHGR